MSACSRPVLSGIEVCRGFAALLVVAYHLARMLSEHAGYPLFWGSTEFGHSGVDFFFVLSGFIICFAHQEELGDKTKLPTFAIKRIARIYPLYLLVFLVTLAVVPLSDSATYPTPGRALEEALLLPVGHGGLIVGVAWSLQYEMLFYVLFATLFVHPALGKAVLTSWFGLILVHQLVAPISPFEDWYVFTSIMNLHFLVGFGVAWLFKHGPKFSPEPLLMAGGGMYAITALLDVTSTINGYAHTTHLLYGCASGLLILGVACRDSRGQKPRYPKLLLRLGRASYSLYLCHILLINIAIRLLKELNMLSVIPVEASFFLVLGGVILICDFVATRVELPLSRKCRDWLLSFHAQGGREHPRAN